MGEKYSLTNTTKEVEGITLYQIKAERDIKVSSSVVKKSTLGGWVEKESNLNQLEDSWIFKDAIVAESAIVAGNAIISGTAIVAEHAAVVGNALVTGDALVVGKSTVTGNATVKGNAIITGDAKITGTARIEGTAVVEGVAKISDGRWEESPLYIRGTEWPFGMYSKNQIRIGRKIFDMDEFQENYLRIAKRYKVPDALINEYVLYFNLAAERYGFEKIERKEQ